MSTTYTIGELAERTGVSRRTIHFYVQQGLINPPQGRGRGSHYTDKHVGQILEVRARQRDGLALDQIRTAHAAVATPTTRPVTMSQSRSSLYARNAVVRIRLDDRLVLEVAGRGRPPTDDVLDRLAEACAQILMMHEEDDGTDGNA